MARLLSITIATKATKLKVLISESPSSLPQGQGSAQTSQLFFPPLKVVPRFYATGDIFLPVFYPTPHTSTWEQRLHSLDVQWALAFYIKRNELFRKLNQLFVVVTDHMKGLLVSFQLISSWIHTCYELAKVPAPAITANSKRANASSSVFLTSTGTLQSSNLVFNACYHPPCQR